ncbi:hypothetical protein GCM10027073_50430 [Streptomyces chlorus]
MFESDRTRARGPVLPCVAQRRREPSRNPGDRRQRGEVRCRGPRARHDPNDRPSHRPLPPAVPADLDGRSRMRADGWAWIGWRYGQPYGLHRPERHALRRLRLRRLRRP